MRYEYIKIILFWSLLSTVPGMIFLIQVVMFMPASMMFANAALGFVDTPIDWGMVVVFGGFFLITAVLWAILTIPLAKLIGMVEDPAARNVLLLLVVAGLFCFTFLPSYGAGGHGPMRWVTAAGLGDAQINYWSMVLPVTLLLVLSHLWYRRGRLRRNVVMAGRDV